MSLGMRIKNLLEDSSSHEAPPVDRNFNNIPIHFEKLILNMSDLL